VSLIGHQFYCGFNVVHDIVRAEAVTLHTDRIDARIRTNPAGDLNQRFTNIDFLKVNHFRPYGSAPAPL
jgi:hypothetical protein